MLSSSKPLNSFVSNGSLSSFRTSVWNTWVVWETLIVRKGGGLKLVVVFVHASTVTK